MRRNNADQEEFDAYSSNPAQASDWVPSSSAEITSEDKIRAIDLTDSAILSVHRSVLQNIANGLESETRERSSIKPLATYVTKLPDRNETGTYLGLDLGGTNFRVLSVQFRRNGEISQTVKKFTIPPRVVTGKGNELFAFLADSVAQFLEEHRLSKKNISIGFTFSFPVKQTAVNRGTLIKWTKAFACEDVVGKDVSELLMDALEAKKMKASVDSLLNDTTGCLVSGHWEDPRTCMGVIVGTGFNICYVERLSKVNFMKQKPKGTTMVLNTEMGSFGENGELEGVRTKWDITVDQISENPGKQLLEKMISGMYMGEIVRLVLLDLVESGNLFKSVDTSRLNEKGAFVTKFVCDVESDALGEFVKCRKALGEVFGTDAKISNEDCLVVRDVCEKVSSRAAKLLAAAISAVIVQMKKTDVCVAVDGTLFRSHPSFHMRARECICRILGVATQMNLVVMEEGSGQGAAIIAAVSRANM